MTATNSLERRFPRPGPLAWLGIALLTVFVTVRTQAEPLFAQILLLLVTVAVGCTLVGSWLLLRRMAMMADAIGHSILLGIVLMFFVVQDPASPLFVLGAALAGLATVAMAEALLATGLVREDASIGMVFAFLFALALVIMGRHFSQAHVDVHVVLAGGVEATVLRQVILDAVLPRWFSDAVGGILQAALPAANVRVVPSGEMSIIGLALGPRALWTMAAITLANLVFVAVLWKELKIATFDPALATSLGFATGALNYGLMTMVAVTAVGAFEAVGSILVIALFVTPAATASLLSDRLADRAVLAVAVAVFDAWLGFQLGHALNANFGASVAVAGLGVFLIAFLLAPAEGLIAQSIRRQTLRRTFALDMLLVHLASHAGTPAEAQENALSDLPQHLGWSDKAVTQVVKRAERARLLARHGDTLMLTDAGRHRASALA